jgi:hypothetical protein
MITLHRYIDRVAEKRGLAHQPFGTSAKVQATQILQALMQRLQNRAVLAMQIDDDAEERVYITRQFLDVEHGRAGMPVQTYDMQGG